MYKGEYSHSIDAKGRVTVPAKLREELGEDFVITRGLDNCLWVLDAKRWAQIEEGLAGLNILNDDERMFRRILAASACDGEVDKQGRMLLPQNLRDYAGLDKEVTFIGAVDRVEIWNKGRYDELLAGTDLRAVSHSMDGRGIAM